MKLFKMLGQAFTNNEEVVILKEKKLAQLVQEYNDNFILSQQKKIISKPVNNTENAINGQNQVLSNEQKQPLHQAYVKSCYVLFSPSGESLLVLKNKEKQELKLYGISHPDKFNNKAKQASNYINDLVKKKTVYYEEIRVNSSIEYKIYLDKEKKASLNELLIQNNLHQSGSEKVNYLLNEENQIKENFVSQKSIVEQNKNEIKGNFVKSLHAPYLFKEENKSSYVVVLENDGKEENYWGVDLQRVVQEKLITKGDFISLENIGPEMVMVEVPVKKNGKIINYESKMVKRNTWTAAIIKKYNLEEELNSNNTQEEQKTKVINQYSNCYALFSISSNSFVCMHSNKKEEYQLKGIDDSYLNSQENKEIKKFLNELISKKVVYIKNTTKENDNVEIYLNKNDKTSINELIIAKFKLNEKNIEEVKENNNTQTSNINSPVVEENPCDNPPIDNDDYGYVVSDDDNTLNELSENSVPEDFFEGFDLEEHNPTVNHNEKNIQANQLEALSSLNKDVLEEQLANSIPDDFFEGFDLEEQNSTETTTNINTKVIENLENNTNKHHNVNNVEQVKKRLSFGRKK